MNCHYKQLKKSQLKIDTVQRVVENESRIIQKL